MRTIKAKILLILFMTIAGLAIFSVLNILSNRLNEDAQGRDEALTDAVLESKLSPIFEKSPKDNCRQCD